MSVNTKTHFVVAHHTNTQKESWSLYMTVIFVFNTKTFYVIVCLWVHVFSFLPVIECSSRNVARPANQPPGPLVRLPQQNQCVCFATPASTVSLQRGGRFPLPPFLLVYSLAFLPRSSLAGSRNCALISHSVTPGVSVDPSRAGLIKRLARTRFERAVSHKG